MAAEFLRCQQPRDDALMGYLTHRAGEEFKEEN